MRAGAVGVILVLTGLAVAPFPSSPAAADCAGPQLTIDGELAPTPASPVQIRRGDPLTVNGRYFVSGCDDTGGGEVFGCNPASDQDPLQDVELLLVAGAGEPISLGVEDADDDGRASWSATIPEDAPLGAARLEASFSEAFHVEVID